MKFPMIGDIASKITTVVNIDDSVGCAIEIMLKYEHRNVVVRDKSDYRLLSVMDVLSFQTKNLDLNTKLDVLQLSQIPVIKKHKNVLDTLEFLNSGIDYICVLNSDNSLYGIVSHTDITSNIDPDTLMDNYRLQDFLKLNRRMKWVNKDDKTSELLTEMRSSSFDNVIIVEKLKPIGILTTKDVMRLIKYKKNLNLPVSCHMSSPVETINKNSSIKQALSYIKQKHYKRVVVTDDEGLLAGVITQKELISLSYSKWAILMKDYQEELRELNSILENKNKEYEAMASTDSLTGLYNRYKFSELYLSSYTAMLQRNNKMSLILLDIDFFKKVNDTYGHNIGDIVLIQIAKVLLKNLRNIDIVCRWGGEEFVVLLPTSTLENAYDLGEKLRKYIVELEIDMVGHVSASFGITEIIAGEMMEDAIERADQALYLAKNSGRNCVKTDKDCRIEIF